MKCWRTHPDATAAKPLPALKNAEWPAGLRIPIDLDVPYAEASRLAKEQFGGRTFRAGSSTYRFDAIRVLPGAGGKIAVEATLAFGDQRADDLGAAFGVELAAHVEHPTAVVGPPTEPFARR